MTMSQSGNGSMQSDINVTPMSDVLLVLLIIFMVIVPVIPRGESASVPQPALHSTRVSEDPVVLEVLKGAQGNADFRIKQQPISRHDLSVRLAAIFANREQRILFVQGDDQLAFNQIAEAIDISRAAGIERVGLMIPKVVKGQ